MTVIPAQVTVMFQDFDPAYDASWAVTDAQTFLTALNITPAPSSTMLDMITKYLAAHFLTLYAERGGLKSDKMDEAQQSYANSGDKQMGLKSTRFGQTAISLDTTGTLASAAADRVLFAQFRVTHAREYRPYRQGYWGWDY